MTNSFLTGLRTETNFGLTANGDLSHKSTLDKVLDMFAQGGAYRRRSDDDCINLFIQAANQDSLLAMKCLFYLRDCREGQGERRFFRVCYRYLANQHPSVARKNLELIPEYGRYDDMIYATFGTELEKDTLAYIKKVLTLDVESKTPSLLAKWLPSINASNSTTKRYGRTIKNYLGMTEKQYRKTLSYLREKINIVERLMSENRWDEIEFDKLPSKAGIKYKNAFARRDMIAKKFETFAKSKDTKVNAAVLYPSDVAHEVYKHGYRCGWNRDSIDETDRAMIQKYWDNLKDYYNGREERGIAVVDTSGSMWGQPLEAAVALGAYVAERGKGPFQNHFITFSSRPELVEFTGRDIYDKFQRAVSANWGGSTDIEATMNLILNTAIRNNVPADEIPTRIYIFSDMQFNHCTSFGRKAKETFFEQQKEIWARAGYKMPQVVFWNLNAAYDAAIPAIGEGFSYISGFSPSMIDCILSGKDGVDLMKEKLCSARYEAVTA